MKVRWNSDGRFPARIGLRPPLAADRVRANLTGAPRAPLKPKDDQMFATPAYAQAAGAGSAFTSFVPLILIFAIMYFLLIRPQQKKVKEHQKMVEALRRGDQVVTAGGLIGKVSKVKEDNEIEVEIATGVKVRLVKSTVAQVLAKTEAASE
jgi:preprotein translocase subunit YajC